MRIVKILGGLGNQMFQYALALSLSKYYPDEVIKIDLSAFNHYPLHNGFELNTIFKNILESSSILECMKYGYALPDYRLWQIGSRIFPLRSTMLRETTIAPFNKEVFNAKKHYFDGYWQSEKYFENIREDILRCYSFPSFEDENNLKLREDISRECTVSVHIRRGDYLKIPLYKGICTKGYYCNAIDKIISLTKVDRFIVFSNDIEWVKENLLDDFQGIDVCFVDWNKGSNSFRDMQLMSLCTHNIIANSSFSWWGAWLNKNPTKYVLTPSKWINLNESNDIIPLSWIRIDE